jgi:hypothetical protein
LAQSVANFFPRACAEKRTSEQPTGKSSLLKLRTMRSAASEDSGLVQYVAAAIAPPKQMPATSPTAGNALTVPMWLEGPTLPALRDRPCREKAYSTVRKRRTSVVKRSVPVSIAE